MNNQKTNNASMSEQELLTDLLHSERDAVKQYASNCTESGCENLQSAYQLHDRMLRGSTRRVRTDEAAQYV